jgi:hypothetical protein
MATIRRARTAAGISFFIAAVIASCALPPYAVDKGTGSSSTASGGSSSTSSSNGGGTTTTTGGGDGAGGKDTSTASGGGNGGFGGGNGGAGGGITTSAGGAGGAGGGGCQSSPDGGIVSATHCDSGVKPGMTNCQCEETLCVLDLCSNGKEAKLLKCKKGDGGLTWEGERLLQCCADKVCDPLNTQLCVITKMDGNPPKGECRMNPPCSTCACADQLCSAMAPNCMLSQDPPFSDQVLCSP